MGLAEKKKKRNIIVEIINWEKMMIIDLSIPRVFIKDKVDEAIFNAKMKGYNLNRHQIAGVITTAIILGYNDHALAYGGTVRMDEGLKGDIYSIIFALIETFKSCPFNYLRNMAMYYDIGK